MNDLQRLRELVQQSDDVKLFQALNQATRTHVGTAPLQARAETINDYDYFATDAFNGRVLPQEKYKAPAKLPPTGVFKTFQKR